MWCRRGCALLIQIDAAEDGVDRSSNAHGGVDHEMELVAVGPFNIEILADESGALLVDGLSEVGCVALRFSAIS